jgi:hypothetical protein
LAYSSYDIRSRRTAPASGGVPEILRLDGVRIVPETDLRFHGGALGRGLILPAGGVLLFLICL